MNTNNNIDARSLMLDRMIRDEKDSFPPSRNGENEIIDFIMENADLALTAEQIDYLLFRSSPPFNPDRDDYFDVLDRMISEAKALGNKERVKCIYMKIPFYPEDKDFERKTEFVKSGIDYFLSIGSSRETGELYLDLAHHAYADIKERIAFCEQALGYLDNSSNEYAGALAASKMLHHMECHENEACLHYCAFGEAVFRNGESIFVSLMHQDSAWLGKSDPLYFCPTILKGDAEYPEFVSLPFDVHSRKVIIDESLTADASARQYGEYELVRHPDEKVICRADGKEYVCHVFSYGRSKRDGEQVIGDTSEKNYFAPGIGLVRTVLSVDGKDCVEEYVYELCDYTVKGGEGLLPLCVGNKWCYMQLGCPESANQIIEREIISQSGDEYLLSGLDYGCRVPNADS